MLKHILVMAGVTLLAVIFAPMVELILHWFYLLMNSISGMLEQVFATNQIGSWIKQILLVFAFTGLVTGLYALINRATSSRLPFKMISIMWASWIIVIMTLVLKP